MSSPDQRKSQRFDLRLPFELVRAGHDETTGTGETVNLSSAGVLFTANAELEIGAPIEYVITLNEGPAGGDVVRLHCVGKVVRRHRRKGTNGDSAVSMAATLERYEFVRPYR